MTEPDPGATAGSTTVGAQVSLEDGRWVARYPEGQVMTWDPDTNAWITPPPGTAGQPWYRPRFTSLQAPATLLYVLFGILILANIFLIAASAERLRILDDIDAGRFVSLDDADRSDDLYALASGLVLLATIPVAAVFIWWTRRATCNVPALGALDPKFTPGWAVGWWFIPFANLVQPFRVIMQAWRASAPGLPPGPNVEWRRAAVSPLLWVWWFTYLAGSLVGGATGFESDPTVGEMITGTRTAIAGGVLSIIAAALAIAVVRSLTARHDHANRRVEAAGVITGAPPRPLESAKHAGW